MELNITGKSFGELKTRMARNEKEVAVVLLPLRQKAITNLRCDDGAGQNST